MDKFGAEVCEKQDEELYALLEKAMSEEKRLTVSEELIQKTLKRVEESSAQTDLKEKSYKKFYRPLRYAGVAAAAVLVLVVGVKTVGNGGFMSKDGMKAESAPGNGMNFMRADSATEAEVYDGATSGATGVYRYICEDKIGVVTESSNAYDAPKSTKSEEIKDYGTVDDFSDAVMDNAGFVETVMLSEEFRNALSSLGYTVTGAKGVCRAFDLAETENPEALIIKKLELWGDALNESEENKSVSPYFDADGVLISEVPLQAGIRVQTDKGMLWVLLGDELYLIYE